MVLYIIIKNTSPGCEKAFLKGEQVAAIQEHNIFEGHNNKVGERE